LRLPQGIPTIFGLKRPIRAKAVKIERLQFGALEKCINVYIWCAIGALAGWLSSRLLSQPSRSAQVENIVVGMFGAFVGGDFIAAQFNGGVVAPEFRISSLGLAVLGAVIMLGLLQWMRKAVGPLKKGRSSQKKRD
jgi:uncharacterized membrane protein YeaQ/YmgE (transglycosylase-associated protein family)